jgi:predicted N-acetyltransferase YhbS
MEFCTFKFKEEFRPDLGPWLADVVVDSKYQKQGIGKELIARTHQAAGSHTTLILLSAPKAQTYYPHIGLLQHPSAWTIPPRPNA